ncbi:MAG TPA: N-6 DNA methylase [Lacipirellulaceae bacterium]|nr:N-6 DNA methylase [Lacipirellulaceae bacterium]
MPKLLRDAALEFDRRSPERDRAFEIVKKWAALESSGKLQGKKERTLQGEFLNDLFSEALGYSIFSENLESWNLVAAYPVPGGEADAAIGFFSPLRNESPRVAIELKGPKVNIDRHRFDGRTPVQQCWDYLNVLPECPWGIVCNYVSFRLYHRNKTPRAYEHFTLQELTKLDRFREFYYVFERGGFLPLLEGQQPRCDELLRRSETRQQEVGGKLYQYYHEQRLSLIDYLRRPPRNKTLDEAIRITQKLLDRIIFIAFCQSRRLLNESTIERTYKDLPPHTMATNPRWENFKQLFRSVDEGNPRSNITAFNGGLFRHDPEVDNLTLDDDRTTVFQEIGTYDFKDEVNVEVLGHLFEQSITDLESLRVEPGIAHPAKTSKPLGKRKREGVYYTPRHITEYVIENTLGPCLMERFAAHAATLGVDVGAPAEQRDPVKWQEYQRGRWEILTRFRVCDPACGSGAFLIEAFDFLAGIYEDVVGEMFGADDVAAEEWEDQINPTILQQNLFGVDLSGEAVEITQLALWIRTAKKGKTLSDLTQNIQSGNSVVDDREADARAFDWQARFPHVFQEGKFDCIIGNPPYVKLQNFRKREPRIAAFLINRYRAAKTGNFDLYLPFIEHGLELLKPTGRLGIIAPNVWLFNEYGAGLRELLAERKGLERFIDFKSHQVFRDATTYTALQFFSAAPHDQIEVADASHGQLNQLQFYPVAYADLGTDAWSLVDENDRRILDKMRDSGVTLEEAADGIIVGIQTSADVIYHLIKTGPGKYFSTASKGEVEIEDEIMRPLVSGQDAVPFTTPPTDTYLIFPYKVTDDECRLLNQKEMKAYRYAWEYLKSHERILRQRESGKFDDDEWYRFGRNQNIDKQHLPKILVPRLLLNLFAATDPHGAVCLDNVDVGGILVKAPWLIWYVAGILNSNACNFAWRKISKPFRGEYRSANRQFIAPLPIPKAHSQKPVGQLAEKLAELHSQRLQLERGVIRRFQVDFTPPQLLPSPLPPKIPGKLRAYDALSATERLAALERFAKRRLKPAERGEWDEYLTKQADALLEIKSAIHEAMNDLNDRVYELYGLTKEDIEYIEGT